jgi:hypothetical protein
VLLREVFFVQKKGDQKKTKFFVILSFQHFFDFTPTKNFHINKSNQNGGYFDGLLGVFRERKQPNASGKGTLVC